MGRSRFENNVKSWLKEHNAFLPKEKLKTVVTQAITYYLGYGYDREDDAVEDAIIENKPYNNINLKITTNQDGKLMIDYLDGSDKEYYDIDCDRQDIFEILEQVINDALSMCDE